MALETDCKACLSVQQYTVTEVVHEAVVSMIRQHYRWPARH